MFTRKMYATFWSRNVRQQGRHLAGLIPGVNQYQACSDNDYFFWMRHGVEFRS
jgi:hypothetical protein